MQALDQGEAAEGQVQWCLDQQQAENGRNVIHRFGAFVTHIDGHIVKPMISLTPQVEFEAEGEAKKQHFGWLAILTFCHSSMPVYAHGI